MRAGALNLCKNLILVVATTTLCFLALETVFRIIAPSNPPGTTYGKPVRWNSEGLRDRDYMIPKGEDTYRILVLGDSFTWGVGLEVEDTIPKLLERNLAELSSIGKVEIINAADPGLNTVEELNLFRGVGLRYEPDMVLLLYNLNDIEYLPHLAQHNYSTLTPTPVVEIDPGEEITQYSQYSGFRGVVLEVEKHSQFVTFLVPRIGSLLRRTGLIESTEFSLVAKIFQGFTDANPGWLESKRALSEMAEMCRIEQCELLVAIFPLFVELEDYKGKTVHKTILDFCDSVGVEAIDLLPLFENTKASSHWVNFMDGHPNAYVHKKVAEYILPLISKKLANRRGILDVSPSALQLSR